MDKLALAHSLTTRGTPRGLFGSNGSITLHSKSVRS